MPTTTRAPGLPAIVTMTICSLALITCSLLGVDVSQLVMDRTDIPEAAPPAASEAPPAEPAVPVGVEPTLPDTVPDGAAVPASAPEQVPGALPVPVPPVASVPSGVDGSTYWPACLPITLRVDLEGVPSGFDQLLLDAAGAMAGPAGLAVELGAAIDLDPAAPRLVDRGTIAIGVAPRSAIDADEPHLLGRAWRPLGAAPDRGVVFIAQEAFSELPVDRSSGQSVGAVLTHEIGHVLGFGHVEDPTQLMAPAVTALSPAGPSPAESAVLRFLGERPCAS